ncbi:MAG: GAF domain-containing protein, partial [Planctomycetes bacterium]|nr:GAF domain-containing protein [Planctomycetota bacterium]
AVGLRKDGSVFSGELHGRSIPYLGNMVRVAAIRDITERKNTQEQIMRHYRELNVLNELSRSLARVKTTREVLRAGLNNALEALSMSQGSAYLFDENTQQLNLIVHTGIGEQSAKRGRKISGNSRFANLSFGTGQVFSIKDIELDERINNELREALSSEKIRSIACIPLTSQNKVRGILCIGKTRPIDLTSDEIRLM